MIFSIVPMLPLHLDGMAALEQLCFSMPWSRAMLSDELQNEYAIYFVAEDEQGCVAGYCGMHTIIDEGYITNLAVRPDCRRCGLGGTLIRRVERAARECELHRLTLEVRASNVAAISLYKQHGFTAVGTRPNYYTQPTEDALLMHKKSL